jgi:hypothetical protein
VDIKNVICNAIESKKQEMITEYDNKINDIKNETNSSKLYYLLAKTFHNTVKQGELGIQFLKTYLTNDFFQNAEVKNGCNYITFSNNDYDISFSKSLSTNILIKYKSAISIPYYYEISKNKIKLADLMENYLNHKSFKNLKILVEYNYYNKGYKNNFIATIYKYIQTYKHCNKELLNTLKEKIDQEKINKKEYEQKKQEYEENQKQAKEFINSLTDLQMFKDNGWNIKLSGIKNEDGSMWFC